MQLTISPVFLKIGVHQIEFSLPVGFWHLLQHPFAMLPDAVILGILQERFVGQFEIAFEELLLLVGRSDGVDDELDGTAGYGERN